MSSTDVTRRLLKRYSDPSRAHLLQLLQRDWWVVFLDGSQSRQTGILAALKQQGFSYDYDRIPRLSQWNSGSILFSAAYGDAVTVWRMPVSATGNSIGRAERLTSGTTFEVSPVLAPTGNLVFASLNLTSGIWSLPVDSDRAKAGGDLKRVTNGPFEIMPSISQDGRKLVSDGVAIGAAGGGRPQDQYLLWDLFSVQRNLKVHIKDLGT